MQNSTGPSELKIDTGQYSVKNPSSNEDCVGGTENKSSRELTVSEELGCTNDVMTN